jgi:hypothetical protein
MRRCSSRTYPCRHSPSLLCISLLHAPRDTLNCACLTCTYHRGCTASAPRPCVHVLPSPNDAAVSSAHLLSGACLKRQRRAHQELTYLRKRCSACWPLPAQGWRPCSCAWRMGPRDPVNGRGRPFPRDSTACSSSERQKRGRGMPFWATRAASRTEHPGQDAAGACGMLARCPKRSYTS